MSKMKSGHSKGLKSLLRNWNSFLLLFLVLEFVIFGAANSKFLRIPLLLSSVNDFIAICLISLFVTFVMITGGIDIQAGAIVGLTSITIGVAWQDFGLNIWAAVLVAIVAAALCGALEAACPVRPIVTHASRTARGFFEKRGYRVLRAQQVERRGQTLENFVMEKE